MNVSRVLEANFIRRIENIRFFSHHFWKKNGVSYMPAFLWPDPVVLSQTTQTRQQFSTKKRLDWTSWQRFGSSQSISTIWWCSWESLRQTSNMSLHSIARHIIKHVYIYNKLLLNAKLRILKLDLLSGALWARCIGHNTRWCFFLQLDAKPYNVTVISVLWGEIDVPLTSPGGLLSLHLLGRLGCFHSYNLVYWNCPFFSRNYRA